MTLLLRFSLGFLLVLTALFLIALVLIQRGRGGGLAGAFGGAGGQSAFGTKAGDVFTRITVVVASCWILLCILAINVLGTAASRISPALGGAAGQKVQSEIPATTPADATAPGENGGGAKPDAEDGATPPAAQGEASEPAEGGAAAPAEEKPAAGETGQGTAADEPAPGAEPAQPAAE